MSYCSILPGKYHSNPVIIPIISHFIQSAAAFTLLCLFILLRPSPSTLITVPATDHIQKVSVILCTPHASAQQIVSTYTLLKNGKSLYIILCIIQVSMGLDDSRQYCVVYSTSV